MFLHHIGHEEELLAEVKKRFQLVLSLERQQEENGIFDYEGIPQDLRTCVKLYLGSSMRRQAENYHGYVMACQIQKRVDDENKGETEAVKRKRYKEIFSVIAGNVAWQCRHDIIAISDKISIQHHILTRTKARMTCFTVENAKYLRTGVVCLCWSCMMYFQRTSSPG